MIYGERNGYRMAAFHHLDFSVNFGLADSDRHGFSLGVYNAYNRKNPFFIYFEDRYNSTTRGQAVPRQAGEPLPSHTLDQLPVQVLNSKARAMKAALRLLPLPDRPVRPATQVIEPDLPEHPPRLVLHAFFTSDGGLDRPCRPLFLEFSSRSARP